MLVLPALSNPSMSNRISCSSSLTFFNIVNNPMSLMAKTTSTWGAYNSIVVVLEVCSTFTFIITSVHFSEFLKKKINK
jgi:hypothetical protein